MTELPENSSGLILNPADPVVTLINLFTPKPGKLDAFCETQIAEYRRLYGQVEGSLGANLHRSLDGTKAANYAQFASRAAYDAWIASALFTDHVKVIEPLLDKVEPRLYRLAYTLRTDWGGTPGHPQLLGSSENADGAVIRTSDRVITLINRFTPKPGQTQAFVDAQIGEYRRLKAENPGVFSANLHVSLDGAGAANYAQFASVEAYDAWRHGPLFEPHIAIIKPFLDDVAPALYELVYTLHAPGSRLAAS